MPVTNVVDPALMMQKKGWRTILVAKGYGNSWKAWILGFEAVEYLPCDLPDMDILNLVEQITEHDRVHACFAETKFRSDRFEAMMEFDQKDDFCKTTYRMLKAKKSETLSEVPVVWEVQSSLLRSKPGMTALKMNTYRNIPQFATLRFGEADISFLGQESRWAAKCSLNLLKVSFRHVGVCRWRTLLWLRMKLEKNSAIFGPECGCAMPVKNSFQVTPGMLSMRCWRSQSSIYLYNQFFLFMTLHSGCTWFGHYRLLKLLDRVAGRTMNLNLCRNAAFEILWGFSLPFLTWLWTWNDGGKDSVLVQNSCSAVYAPRTSLHYLEFFVKIVWEVRFHGDGQHLEGFLPLWHFWRVAGRGVKELAFTQKHAFEEALRANLDIGGYSLDLIKAYNTFGRYGVGRIMCRLGMPWQLVNFWIHSLDKMVRYPTLQGCVTQGIASTTGVPEGCSISVLAMLAVSCTFYCSLKSEHVRPFAYADYWSWMVHVQQEPFAAYQRTLHLTDVMRLGVDHAKSWHWSTKKTRRELCKGKGFGIPGSNLSPQVKVSVQDLSEVVSYNKSVSLGFIRDKIDEAVARLQRLEWITADPPQSKPEWFKVQFGRLFCTVLTRHTLVSNVSLLWEKQPSRPWLVDGTMPPVWLDVLFCRNSWLIPVFAFCAASQLSCLNLQKRRSHVQLNGGAQNLLDLPPPWSSTWDKQGLNCDGALSGSDYLHCNVLTDSCKYIVKMVRLMWNHYFLSLWLTERVLASSYLMSDFFTVFSPRSVTKTRISFGWTSLVLSRRMHRKQSGTQSVVRTVNFVGARIQENIVCWSAVSLLPLDLNMSMRVMF